MAVRAKGDSRLTLGPVLFNWDAEKWRDFYFRMADEAPVDVVYLGEVVCSKRAPFFAAVLPDVAERLKKAKKDIVYSSLAMVMNRREVEATRDLAGEALCLVEANDVSALGGLRGRAHVIGPYISVYNEETLAHLVRRGARRFCLSPEIPFDAVRLLAAAAQAHCASLELQVFGRMPLALSARCYHARAHGLTKDNCQFVCGRDADGMLLHTLGNQPFLAVNGIQTLSDTYLNLLAEIAALQDAGVGHFRLSPHSGDMVRVSALYRDVLDGKTAPQEAERKLNQYLPGVRFSNGYFYGQPGHQCRQRRSS